MALMAGTPNQVPAAQSASTSNVNGSADVVNGIRNAADPEECDGDEHGRRGPIVPMTRPDTRDAMTPTRPTMMSASPAWVVGTPCVT